jgi:ABC-2 type transport system permease protein
MIDFLLFRTALRDQLRPARLIGVGFLALLPAIFGLVFRLATQRRGTFEPAFAYNLLSSLLVFWFTLVILAVISATSVVSRELEQGTIVYLLTRPVPRWRILLARFLASFLVITLTVWFSSAALALATFGPAHLNDSRLLRDMAILPVGALAYGSLFLLLATRFRWALIFGLLFAFGWESWVPSWQGDFAKLSLLVYLRTLAPHPQPLIELNRIQSGLFNLLNPTTIKPSMAWLVLGLVTFASLTGALVIFSDREYVPREDAA